MNYNVLLDLTVFIPGLKKVFIATKGITMNFLPFTGMAFNLPFLPSVSIIYFNDVTNDLTCKLDYKFNGNDIDRLYNNIEKIEHSKNIYKSKNWIVEIKTYEDLGL